MIMVVLIDKEIGRWKLDLTILIVHVALRNHACVTFPFMVRPFSKSIP